MPVVTIDGREVDAAVGQSLFDCAQRIGVRVPTSCFGQGKCRECLVEVNEGTEHLSPLAEEELHLGGAFRLTCRSKIASNDGRIRCQTLRRGAMRIEDRAYGLSSAIALEPRFRRAGDDVTRDGETIDDTGGPLFGLAVDLGTTTVVVRLVDLESGERVATQSFENPQRFGGSDVMARIRYDGDHPGRVLQRTLLGYLTHAIEDLPCESDRIVEVVVGANTTMRDLLFGLDVQPIGQDPYRSTTEEALERGERATTAIDVPARRLRLPLHPEARVYGLPLIASHVGADTAACLLATGLADEDRLTVLMDIGTNTELVATDGRRILAASCPAGPAFEGGAIRFGMPGLEGAIERVALADDGSTTCEVIGGGEPQGICGSGLVDLLSELLRTEQMNDRGRFDDDVSEVVVEASRGIVLSEPDVNELAQAKGANAAGVRAVLDQLDARPEDVRRFYLAGGFARYIDVAAARRIGLVPDLADERFEKVGNAALEGATIALLSMPRRRHLEELVKTIEHVRLEMHPRFFDFFVDGCQFKPSSAVD